jgi:hypothetical protein
VVAIADADRSLKPYSEHQTWKKKSATTQFKRENKKQNKNTNNV